MPSSVVHLFVANKFLDVLKIQNIPQFYLGAISPDSVNLEGFADQETRYSAHIRSRDVSKWLMNIKTFVLENEKKYCDENDFFKGYIIHLLTDIAWDEVVQPRLFKGLIKAGFEEETLGREKWNELYKFNAQLMKETLWEEIKKQLKNSHGVNISTVSAELVEKFRDDLISNGYEKVNYDKPLILSPEDVEITVSKAKEVYSEIN